MYSSQPVGVSADAARALVGTLSLESGYELASNEGALFEEHGGFS